MPKDTLINGRTEVESERQLSYWKTILVITQLQLPQVLHSFRKNIITLLKLLNLSVALSDSDFKELLSTHSLVVYHSPHVHLSTIIKNGKYSIKPYCAIKNIIVVACDFLVFVLNKSN